MLKLSGLTVALTLFLLAVVCSLAVIISLKWLKPSTKLGGPVTLLIVVMMIMGFASIELLGNSTGTGQPKLSEQEALYKQMYWQQHEHGDFVLTKAIELWEEQPNDGSKLALGIAYMKAEQWHKGIRVLSELSAEKELELPLEADKLRAYTEEAAELLTSASPDELQEQAVIENVQEMTESLIAEMNKEWTDRLEDKEEQRLIVLAKLDPARIHYMYHSSTASSADTEEKILEITRLYNQVMEELEQVGDNRRSADAARLGNSKPRPSFTETAYAVQTSAAAPLMSDSEYFMLAAELAETSLYMNDYRSAQTLLLDVVENNPNATQSSLVLSELLLDGRADLSDEQLRRLPYYSEALLQRQKQESKLYSNWASQVISSDESAASFVEERLPEIQEQFEIEPYLAYSILQANDDKESAQAAFLLSNYHYQTQNLEDSSYYIEQLTNNPSALTKEQQYYIQQLQLMPDSRELSLDDLQIRHEATNQLYNSFKTLNGQRLHQEELASTEKGFAVYLSDKLVSFNRSSMQISSIQATADGKVEMYVTARNMKDLKAADISLRDNAVDVKDFKLEKIGESVSYERNIALVVDRSGSMQGDRIEGAKLALQSFTGSMVNKERIGLIAFNDSPAVLQSMTTDLSVTHDSIDQLYADGGTNITQALHDGLSMLESQSGERILFILSDGEDSNFSQPLSRMEIIERANQAGVTIFAIGFAAGYETLRDVADATGGQYIAASGIESLLSNFDEIKKTMESTYKISYELDFMTEGLHRVRVTDSQNLHAMKTYTIESQREPDTDEHKEAEEEKEALNGFGITGTSPNRIIASKTGSTKLTIRGIGLNDAEELLFDKKAVKFKKISDSELEITLSNNLAIGMHELKMIANDQREDTYHLSVTNSSEQEFRLFGDAKVYGDFIEDKDGVSTLKGNASVDRFIYDSKGSMVLKDGAELTFRGMLVEVDNTKLGLILTTDHDHTNMTVNADQKTFEIEVKGAASQVLDQFTMSKFGLDVLLMPKFEYEAKVHNDEGTLTATGGVKGFSSILGLNDRLAEVWTKKLKFAPSDASLTIGYEKDNIAIGGEIGASLQIGTLFETGTVALKADYVHQKAKFDIGLDVADFSGNFRAFTFDMSRLPVNSFGLSVGWQKSWIPKAAEVSVGSNKGVPLGTSGLTARGITIGIDVREGVGGVVGLEVGTAVDGPVQEIIRLVNRVPLFEISESACVICIEGELGAKSLGTSDWALNGALAMKLLGFEASKGSGLINKHEVSAKVDISYLGLEGNLRLLWSDKAYKQDTTVTVKGLVDWLGVDADLILFMNVTRTKKSYVDIKIDTWLYDPHIHIGANVEVYR